MPHISLYTSFIIDALASEKLGHTSLFLYILYRLHCVKKKKNLKIAEKLLPAHYMGHYPLIFLRTYLLILKRNAMQCRIFTDFF